MSPGSIKFALLEHTTLGENQDQGSRQHFPQIRLIARILRSPGSVLVCLLMVAKKNTKRAFSCRVNSVQHTTRSPGVCRIFCPPTARARINTNKQVGQHRERVTASEAGKWGKKT